MGRLRSAVIGVLRELFRDLAFTLGFSILMFFILLSAVGQVIVPFDYCMAGAFEPLLPPNPRNPLGTDILGRDLLAQLIYSTPNSLFIGLIVGTFGTFVGTTLGFISGYKGGVVDLLLSLFIDIFLAIPSLLILILIASFFRGTDYITLALIISLFSWAWPARQMRAQALSLKEREFVYLARLSNEPAREVIIFELMPFVVPWMIANFINANIVAILTESSLSLIGLGPGRSMTLGMMLYWALSYSAIFRGTWWWWVTPVVALSLISIALYLIYVGLTRFITRLEEVY